MQVLHLISSGGFFGAENMLIELSKELRDTTFLPIVGVFKNLYNPHLEIVEEARQFDLPVEIFPCKGKLDIKTILSLRRFLGKQGIDIVHTHGYKSNLYALASSFGKKAALITTCHNWLGEDPKMKFYAMLDKFLLNRFNKIIAVSDSVRQEILDHNVSPNKVLIINNGINLSRFNNTIKTDEIRTEFGIDGDCKVIGTVGRLSQEKGLIYFLQAAKTILRQYPKTVFLIVGDGPLRKDLERISAEFAKSCCSKSAIIFTGIRIDMPALYSIMDVFVLPSLTEGLPMALLEAMAAKKPVVATKVGAVPKVIQDGHSGYLVEPGDEEGLTKAITGLLENPQRAFKMAENAYEIVRKHFSSHGMAEKYEQVYREVLGVRKATGRG